MTPEMKRELRRMLDEDLWEESSYAGYFAIECGPVRACKAYGLILEIDGRKMHPGLILASRVKRKIEQMDRDRRKRIDSESLERMRANRRKAATFR
jgi:hypothetical protein